MQIALAGCCAAPAAVKILGFSFHCGGGSRAEFAMVSVAAARDGNAITGTWPERTEAPAPPWRLSDAETTPGNRMGRRAAGLFRGHPYLARNALMSCFLVMVDRPLMPTCLALRRRSGTFQSS